jgi:hypothetical protein
MIVMVTSFVSAIRINEFEANPSGSDSGNEWVELYSEEEIDLEGYYLQADNETLELNGVFSGYLVISFESQFIDNVNEIVYLKRGEDIIDETEMLDDSKNNGKTWNFCGEEWEFLEDSKGEINSCSEDSEDDESEEDSDEDGEEQEENDEETSQEENEEQENEEQEKEEKIQSETTGKIILNSRGKDSANKEFVSSEKKVRLGVVYGFLILCVFLIILLALRRL